KLSDSILVTLCREPDCYANEVNPHTYKLLTEYRFESTGIRVMSGYEKNGKINITDDITNRAMYWLRPINTGLKNDRTNASFI
ncbi:hypothetical protein LCGC14_1867240, partial [marine sediment metagenome]